MIDQTTKLRWRRRVKRHQQQIGDIGSTTEEQLDRHFFRRLGRLYEVRRFLISWLLLVVLLVGVTIIQTRALGGYYQSIKPLAGGVYSEGIVGSFTNANPIYATSEVDSAISHLVFSGLMTYDHDNHLVEDLSVSLTHSASGKKYTAVIKKGVTWHDGKPLTAKDVVFTYHTIQNPDAKSSLFSSWQGIKISAPDDYTVVFKLPNAFAPFPYSLTNGILPEHLLKDTDPSNLRSDLFNTTRPVGTGPFMWNRVEVRGNDVTDREQRMSLLPNNRYYQGRPKLNGFIVRAFLDEDRMVSSFDAGELTAMAGVQDVTDKETKSLSISQYNIPITGAVMTFLRTSAPLLKDVKLRRALASATNQKGILSDLTYSSTATNSPLLRGMIGYDSAIVQRSFNLSKAKELLGKAGWKLGPDGIRISKKQKLTLDLKTLDNLEYANVANILKKQWLRAGVDLQVTSLSQKDLQAVISSRDYDVLLYGVSLGIDPDQFAYWHSSQADVHAGRRLNFSDYKSGVADAALEAGRARVSTKLREVKYIPFLEAWRDDVPAITLYRPHFLYVTRGAVFNFNLSSINTPANRYADVEDWMVRTERGLVK